ncbi:SH3 domain-containing protein [Pseudahrensia aquimaris]|uniref:SH3 domain-containing protein n=1 Tax=Pseudahrensia aquimaris TaxID=744461 RepID=A0ABW3FKT9_9HYPH
MSPSYRVIVSWKASYSDPIAVQNGEQVWLSGKTDEWDGHVWLWAKDTRGKEGWVPDSIIEATENQCFAKEAFSALELS